ncbi:MAG: hypothetical protein ACYSWX_05345 [Planctomycetota bacterium]|jgi:hypothetical protein
MPTLEQLMEGLPTGAEWVWAAGVPFFLALLLGAIGSRSRDSSRGAAVGTAIGLLFGWLSTHIELWGLPPLPPIYASDWLVLIATMATLATLWTSAGERSGALATVIPLTAALAAVALTIRPRILAADWSATEAAGQALLVGGPILLGWLSMERTARRRPTEEVLTLLLLVTVATSVAIGMSGSQKLAQGAGGLAAGLTALLLLGLRSPAGSGGLALGAAGPSVALVGGLAMNGTLYAELGRDLHLLLLAPFVLAGVAARLPGGADPGRLARVGRAILIASPALVAAGLAVTRFEVADDGGGYY